VIVLSHPTGNAFVRAVMIGLEQAAMLDTFQTTLAYAKDDWFADVVPATVKNELTRRSFPIPSEKIYVHPLRELVRLMAPKLGMGFLTKHEKGIASVDAVYQALDQDVAEYISDGEAENVLTGVYAYEDCALNTFKKAHELGLKCFYDLPIAYWQTSRQLLKEEAKRLPEWEPTLIGTRDSVEKLARKTDEIALADVVICPSKFVLDSLPGAVRRSKTCLVAEFGTPEVNGSLPELRSDYESGPLRVLFAGSMSQRKGLADVFSAFKLLRRSDVELVVMGSPAASMDFYRRQYNDFHYEIPRPHNDVLNLMRTCHVFVLPSIVEGRALVQQEAMLCGLPIIVTANAGGEDLVEEGKTGYLVPIQSPEFLAEKISWFADHRNEIQAMGRCAQERALQVTWDRYRKKILSVILPMVAK
jgi:glycosyltransferase involved in cell wall biosynthesis